jgi:hypothetical protein
MGRNGDEWEVLAALNLARNAVLGDARDVAAPLPHAVQKEHERPRPFGPAWRLVYEVRQAADRRAEIMSSMQGQAAHARAPLVPIEARVSRRPRR